MPDEIEVCWENYHSYLLCLLLPSLPFASCVYKGFRLFSWSCLWMCLSILARACVQNPPLMAKPSSSTAFFSFHFLPSSFRFRKPSSSSTFGLRRGGGKTLRRLGLAVMVANTAGEIVVVQRGCCRARLEERWLLGAAAERSNHR